MLRSRLLRGASGLIRLVRPLNCLMFFAGTYVGGVIVDRFSAFDWPDSGPLLLASSSTLLVGAGANAINDVFDLTADTINRPGRPIPSGTVTVPLARTAWVGLTVLGVVVGFAVSALHGLIAISVAAILYLYSARLKSLPLAGNVVIGATISVALVYGGLVFGNVEPLIPAVVFAFLTNFAREVIKDVQDLPGDMVQHVDSLPVRKGVRSGVALFLTLIGVTIVLSPLPFAFLGYGGLYLLLIMFADGVLLAAVWAGMQQEDERFAARASALVKTAMVFGLGALSVAGVVG